MLKFFNSIRIINSIAAILLMVALQHVFHPSTELHVFLQNRSFSLLLVTLFLALSGGYAFNNGVDFESDKINNKNTNIFNGSLLIKLGIISQLLSIILAYFLPSYLFWNIVYINTIIVLYNTYFKKVVLVGNLFIAFLSLFPYYISLQINVIENNQLTHESTVALVLLFALVSFLGTLSREIIKDIEDIKGDQKTGVQTLPIQFSINIAKYASAGLSLATLVVFNFILYNYKWIGISAGLTIFGFIVVSIPLFLSIAVLLNKKINNPKQAQQFIKVAMFFSIIFLLFI